MSSPKGIARPLTLGRRLVNDLLRYARRVPSLPLSRRCSIVKLCQARAQAAQPVSWMALFMKAYGLAGERYPELRRAYIPYPRVRIYEHPRSDCAILVERDVGGEICVLAAKIHEPERTPLATIDEHLRRFRNDELRAISPFRQLLRLGRLPRILRSFVFWSTLYFSGYKRAKRFGTFMMSSLGNLGVEQIHPLTPLTTYFTFGPIGSDGTVNLKIIYDHRVMDGRLVGRVLVDLENILNHELADELTQLSRQAA